MRLRTYGINTHVLAFCCAQRRGVYRHTREAAYIHAVMIRRGALIVKHINPALAAKVMLRDTHIPLIERQRRFARRDGQVRLWHLHHDCAAHFTERTVSRRKLGEVRGDLKADSAAMANGVVGGHGR